MLIMFGMHCDALKMCIDAIANFFCVTKPNTLASVEYSAINIFIKTKMSKIKLGNSTDLSIPLYLILSLSVCLSVCLSSHHSVCLLFLCVSVFRDKW